MQSTFLEEKFICLEEKFICQKIYVECIAALYISSRKVGISLINIDCNYGLYISSRNVYFYCRKVCIS